MKPFCSAPNEPRRTLQNFLAAALSPVGRTLYVYGGGWDGTDTGAGTEARSFGCSPAWERFFAARGPGYDYREPGAGGGFAPLDGKNPYRFAGLDCSGYLGWALFQVLGRPGGPGFVVSSTQLAGWLAERGLGTLERGDGGPVAAARFRPGDIFSLTGHVWLCLGTCADGSLVIVHSSPTPSRAGFPGGGVQLSALNPGDDENPACDAARLARQAMERLSPVWSSRYPAVLKRFRHYAQPAAHPLSGLFRWDEAALSDREGYRGKTAEEILEELWGGPGDGAFHKEERNP